MAENLPSKADLIKLFKLSAKKPMAFCFAIGKTKDESKFVLHKKKAGKGIYAMVKKEAENITKGCWGTVQLGEKKTLKITFEKELPGMEKVFKEWLKSQDLQMYKAEIDGGKK